MQNFARSTPVPPAVQPASARVNRLRALIAGCVLAALIAVIAVMVTQVVRQLRELQTASSDNIQWTLSQVDAEFLRFRHAIDLSLLARKAGPPPAEVPAEILAELRKHFDIFYSRVDTFRGTGSYSSLRLDQDFETAFSNTVTELDALGAVMDLPDADLATRLDTVDAQAEVIGPTVRELSLMGLVKFAHSSDQKRAEMTSTLALLAGTTGLMLVAISLLAVLLLRLYRLSEQRAVQQQKTTARMRLVIQNALDGIIACDSRGQILVFNPAAERIFGYTSDEAIGRDLLDALLPGGAGPSGHRMLAAILRDPAPETLGRVYLDGRTRAGQTFPAEVSVRLAEGDQGPVCVLFIRDISQLKKAEADLIEAHDRAVAGEKAKADFVAVMSHEIRTPLNGLLGNMSLLLDTPLDPQQRGYVSAMEVSGRLLSSLVNDVLDISKLEAGKMQIQHRSFRLSAVLDEIIASQRQLAHTNGNALDWGWVGPAFEPVIGDPDKIRQVVINFVNNAIKFTRDGAVHVEIEALGTDPARREVEIRVSDTGEGISEENIERIFSDFEMIDSSYGRRPGTGLGLGIARRLAGLMGGEIGVESELGDGSLFWLRLPLERDPAGTVATPLTADAGTEAPPKPAQAIRPLSILIVEDNDINRAILHRMVEIEGHDVVEARDGREGVERAALWPFDAILMDVSMPVMDGRAAARAIRAGGGASCAVPIIAVTAHALPEEREAFRAAGMTEILNKPIDREDLRRLLARLARDTAQGAERGSGPRPPAQDADRSDTDRSDTDLSDTDILDTAQLGAEGLGALGSGLLPLVDGFVAQADELIAGLSDGSLGAGATEEDAHRIRIAAIHRCAGSAGTFGARAFHARLQSIETAAKRGDDGPLDAASDDLAALWARTRAALLDWRHSLG